jgi:hypothetical protein
MSAAFLFSETPFIFVTEWTFQPLKWELEKYLCGPHGQVKQMRCTIF